MEHRNDDAGSGLTRAQVLERIKDGKTNRSRRKSSRSYPEILRENVFTFFNGVLGVLLLIVLIAGSPQDGLFGLVIVINSLIGIVQEVRAKRTLDRLSLISAPKARALREGRVEEIPYEDVVLDDLLELRAGDQVVADGILLSQEGLEIDESLLTGESLPVRRQPGERLLSGSFASAGSGRYQVDKVGGETYAQDLAREAGRFRLVRSELREGTARILKGISWALLPVAALLAAGQLRTGQGWKEASVATVAGIVGIIPQGLVLLTSLAFAASVISLARRKVLVEELPAVEGLARVDVLCLDKTGTLTDGSLELKDVFLAEGASPQAEEALGALGHLGTGGNLTSEAIGRSLADPGWKADGTVPFSSRRKWSAAAFAGCGCWVLGAPEILFASASVEAAPLADLAKTRSRDGLRVLLLCRASRLPEGEDLPADLIPEALVLLEERIREDAPRTLSYFREQGVRLKVFSGDHPATAASVASKAGLEILGDPVDARELPEDQGELSRLLEERTVFGRVTPVQKRRMIRTLQQDGHTVAMTGDGVNDVLALKEADLGIAMGSGAGMAKSVARLVLLDGRFETLPFLLGEGRKVMANIERVANLFLTKTVYVLALILGVSLAGWPFPYLPRHLTLISDLSIGIPAFFLALAPNPRRYVPGFLRRILWFVLPVGLLTSGAILGAFFLVLRSPLGDLAMARTGATLVSLTVCLWVASLLARPLTLWKGVLLGGLAGALGVFLGVPFLRGFFALSLPPASLLPGLLLTAAGAIGLIEGVWRLDYRKGRSGSLEERKE